MMGMSSSQECLSQEVVQNQWFCANQSISQEDTSQTHSHESISQSPSTPDSPSFTSHFPSRFQGDCFLFSLRFFEESEGKQLQGIDGREGYIQREEEKGKMKWMN